MNSYKPNVVYILRLQSIYYYVGCHCLNKPFISESHIITKSGNYLALQIRKNITLEEYKECVELLHVEEFDSRRETSSSKSKD